MFRRWKRLFLCVCLILVGCQNVVTPANETIDMVLITKHNLGDYYQTMLRGAQTAEKEITTVKVQFLPVADEGDLVAQSALIDEAVANQVEAILISPNEASATQSALHRAKEAGIPVIVLDSPVAIEGLTYVGTDNVELGRTIAQRLKQQQVQASQLAIIMPQDYSRNIVQRVEAIESAFSEQKISILTLPQDQDKAVEQLTAYKKMHPGITQWVTITELMTEAAGRAVKLNGWQDDISIIGVDSNTTILQWLEQGIIDKLIVQNSYAMGYLAVYSAYNTRQNIPTTKYQDTLYLEVTKDNLFDEALAPLLFPIK
ncbi:substrate-binding domain-containing protein [Aerococcaceae bacterium NML210727]|nr:substrate-binding domain-containing protein [Aerococcaceae bacterium NML210727]MCW6653990.1 substrate-binding domain-containing protein [Aerococcaceae bacterium NML201296]